MRSLLRSGVLHVAAAVCRLPGRCSVGCRRAKIENKQPRQHCKLLLQVEERERERESERQRERQRYREIYIKRDRERKRELPAKEKVEIQSTIYLRIEMRLRHELLEELNE